ncbi:hypothetical protein L1887_14737 [Cichorium endivia]|nr:hypothetical protein L1887_14737 [Cichorium endivia]
MYGIYRSVMMRLFSPRKTTLIFVIRDKTRTPLENLEPILREDIQKKYESFLTEFEIQDVGVHLSGKILLPNSIISWGRYKISDREGM